MQIGGECFESAREKLKAGNRWEIKRENLTRLVENVQCNLTLWEFDVVDWRGFSNERFLGCKTQWIRNRRKLKKKRNLQTIKKKLTVLCISVIESFKTIYFNFTFHRCLFLFLATFICFVPVKLKFTHFSVFFYCNFFVSPLTLVAQ